MASVKLYWPTLLSLICLAIAVYFSLTNTAYVLMGCPYDTYPEAGFLFIGVPASLGAFCASLLAARSKQKSRLRPYWIQTAISVALIALCIWMIASVFVPSGSTCT